MPAPPAIAALMLEDRVDMDSAAVASAQTPSAAPLTPGFYLQLGSYGRAGKAEEMGEKLRQAGVDLEVAVVRSGSVNRLYGGPFETRALAQEAARALPAGLGLKPIVVRR
jgi:rare lipoprotein A